MLLSEPRLPGAEASCIVSAMARSPRSPASLRGAHPLAQVFLATLAFLLLVVPALDLAWSEPTLDEGQGVRCHLHANPVLSSEALAGFVWPAGDLLLPFDSPIRLLPIAFSIFIPPRL